jgi:serine/threonine-protein kinase RsbW
MPVGNTRERGGVRVNRTAARNSGQRGDAGAELGASVPPPSSESSEPATPAASDRPPGGGSTRDTAQRGDIVVLTLPASSAYLSVLRTATAGLAARLQFTLDEIEDLRIAVDEACAMLLAGGESEDTELHCRFALATDQITVTVSIPADNPVQPSRETFAWQVLAALAGSVEASARDGRLVIELTKRRSRNP